ncbi:MAG: UDP-N-acetylglucosamine 2-epimerase (non-hydrolyzing) [Cytophagaceae bacterium]|nr:UDP-N-acetylglucosamine 2-epimerase (non-hydrolyzing) [Gemmatimonadaceae bacterium]
MDPHSLTPHSVTAIGGGGRYRVCVIVGTRAEGIKLAPVIRELERHRRTVQTIVVTTALHREMLAQALEAFGILPQVDLGLMSTRSQLADFTSRALLAMTSCFTEMRPDLVLVQGDNSTVLAASLAAHYLGIPVGHVDAGLRSANMRNPFPEELNRRLAAVVADLHFTPTARARENLLREGVNDAHIVATGNTILDAIRLIPRKAVFDEAELNMLPWGKRRVITVTMHRRESLGEPLQNVCHAIAELAAMHGDLQVIFPVHLNPRVRDVVLGTLDGVPRVTLLEPVGYADMLELLRRSEFAMTDAGTVQEECAALGRPVLILRRHTDRPEVVESGFGKLVGTETQRVVDVATRWLDDARELDRMSEGEQPYGDGLASVRIVQTLMSRAPRHAGGSPVAEGPALLPPRRAVEP